MADTKPLKLNGGQTAEMTTGDTVPAGNLPIVTSVGNPGSDTAVPSEKAVRTALAAVGGGSGGGVSLGMVLALTGD